jgi:hypothetical protein
MQLEGKMEKIEFNLLRAEVGAQIKEIDKIYSAISERKKGAVKNIANLESLGYKLHNLYCAFEDLFKIVARHFENSVEDIARYHKELLKRMSFTIEDVRPALLSEESFRLLDELRMFRHIFRHAYAYDLQYEKLKPVIKSADMLRGLYKREIERFLQKLNDEIDDNSVHAR